MCSHHLIELVACTPASGWEKGQIENQVGNLRDQMFRPKPRVKSLTELNASSVKNCQRPDLESEMGTKRQLSLPGIGVAEGDSLQI